MNRLLKKLNTASTKFAKTICNAENELRDKIDFEFSIVDQAGDGFVIEARGDNAPMDKCLEAIKNLGRLDYDTYLELCI